LCALDLQLEPSEALLPFIADVFPATVARPACASLELLAELLGREELLLLGAVDRLVLLERLEALDRECATELGGCQKGPPPLMSIHSFFNLFFLSS
jgi:hypothetical protein